jgi:transketolase
MKNEILPRDAFIDTVFEHAATDPRVCFITADLGAKALDRFRAERPTQFLHAGICEQNMIDMAAGLSQCGKTVFVYAMGPFVTLRCYEQIKVAVASMHLPLCIIGNGVGYSYDDAGPTHYATEDITCMRGLGNCEILNPSDTRSTVWSARMALDKPALRYIRLDRKHLPEVYSPTETRFAEDGVVEVLPGKDALILTNGYMYHRAVEVRNQLAQEGLQVGVADVFRIKPIGTEALQALAHKYPLLVSLEEHCLSGGLGGAICEALSDAGVTTPLLRVGIEDQYHFQNGGRAHIHKIAGIDPATVSRRIKEFVAQRAVLR